MVYCSQCGTESPPDALFCSKCGAALPSTTSHLERNIDQVSREIDHLGRRIDHAFRERHAPAESRFDRTFGIFGPLIGSIIGFIVLFVVIVLLDTLAPMTPVNAQVAAFLRENLALFFGLMIIGGYVSYLARKFPPFRWVSPLVGAGIFFILFWLVSRFLVTLAGGQSNSTFAMIADQFVLLVIPLTLLILILGYVGLLVSQLMREPPSPPAPPRTPQTPESPSPVAPPRAEGWVPSDRLYRSGRERILGGVCGGIAEYLHIDPVIVRVLFVLGAVLSFGVVILGYVVLWVIIPRNPRDAW